MKTCTKCGAEKALDEFPFMKSRGRHRANCKTCVVAYQAAYREANKERLNERSAAYYKANKERILERSAAYYEANREQAIERKAAYRKANRERVAEQQAAYYRANRERVSERKAVYRKTANGKEVARKADHKRRARKQGGILTPGAVDHVPSNQCYWCGDTADKMHEDHVIPLVRGGSNEPMNLVWACAPCNHRKHAKHPLRWIAEQFEEAV